LPSKYISKRPTEWQPIKLLLGLKENYGGYVFNHGLMLGVGADGAGPGHQVSWGGGYKSF